MVEKRTNSPGVDFLQVADYVAQEHGIEKDAVFSALELALAKPARMKYGERNDIIVSINRDTGEMDFYRRLKVVAVVGDPYKEINVEEAKASNPDIEIGGEILDRLPPINFDRIAAQATRQVITEKIQETRRILHYNEYADRVGELISVTVKRNEITYVLAEFGNKVEGIFRKEDLLPQEKLKVGERVKAIISDIRPEGHGPVISLSRTHPRFLIELIKEEVNEVAEGIIEIKSAARDSGSRAKVAVYAPDKGIDAVGVCVGVRGSRIQAVSNELMGEKVDVIEWSADPATYVINALAPAEISKVVIDEEKDCVEVIVSEDQLSLAIGRRGQNVKLASILTGFKISVLTEKNEAERYAKEIETYSQLFIESLNIDEMIGRLLAVEGYTEVEQIAEDDIDGVASIEGLDKEIAEELIKRAKEYIEKKKKDILAFFAQEKVNQDFIDYPLFHLEHKKLFVEDGIRSLKDLAELSSAELLDILPKDTITREEADKLIMDLRHQYLNI